MMRQSATNVMLCIDVAGLRVLVEDVTRSCEDAEYQSWRLATGLVPLAVWATLVPICTGMFLAVHYK